MRLTKRFAKRLLQLSVIALIALLVRTQNHSDAAPSISAPVLKWQNGGCYSSWCETGWYSSPAVADLDGDGNMEIIASAYSVIALDGKTGNLLWRVKSGHDRSENPDTVDNIGRTWAGIVLADIDGDGQLEIVTAHGSGWVAMYNEQGYFEPGFPRHLANEEFRSLAAGDLDGDGTHEIVLGRAKLDRLNVWVLEHTGEVRPGFPQLNSSEGSAAGIYNDTIALGDIDGDGDLELVIPSDTITIAAYDENGNQLPTNTIYHDHPGHDMDKWSEVPAYILPEYEERGWGPCYDEFTARANFANGPANITDMNGDGTMEIVAIGDVHNCNTLPYTDLYNTPFIFNPDRTRFNSSSFDWNIPPQNTGAPLSQDYNLIENIQPNPVTVDLDGDGLREILFPSYDGKMHAMWLDKTEHANWPFSVYQPGQGYYRFASEPVVADLDANGSPEVLFTSWTQKGSHATGDLFILDAQGNLLQQTSLPPAYGSPDWNGALAAPTLANIDQDADLEIVINTAHSGVVAYDLPGSANAIIYWGTGRGSYLRNGSPAYGDLNASRKTLDNPAPAPGDTLDYTVVLHNQGGALESAALTDSLPPQVAYTGSLSVSSGTAWFDAGTIYWQGPIQPFGTVTVTYQVRVTDTITAPTPILNQATIQDGQGNTIIRQALAIAKGTLFYLPWFGK